MAESKQKINVLKIKHSLSQPFNVPMYIWIHGVYIFISMCEYPHAVNLYLSFFNFKGHFFQSHRPTYRSRMHTLILLALHLLLYLNNTIHTAKQFTVWPLWFLNSHQSTSVKLNTEQTTTLYSFVSVIRILQSNPLLDLVTYILG